MEAEVLLPRVVVDEPDGRVTDGRVAEHLAQDELSRVACADDEQLLAARHDRARRGPLDDRAREQPHTHHEGEEEEQVHDPDPAGDRRGVEVEEREDEEGGDDGRADSPEDAPHVLGRDVPPPAVVEAEGDEDGEHDADDEQDDVPLEVAVVVDRPRVALEAHVPRRHPGERDQRRVDGDLPEAVAVDGRAHGYAGTPTAARMASTTRSCCSSSIPAHIGTARFSAAARSVSGSKPSATPR